MSAYTWPGSPCWECGCIFGQEEVNWRTWSYLQCGNGEDISGGDGFSKEVSAEDVKSPHRGNLTGQRDVIVAFQKWGSTTGFNLLVLKELAAIAGTVQKGEVNDEKWLISSVFEHGEAMRSEK